MTPDAFGRIDKQLILPVSTSVRGTAPSWTRTLEV